jgi:hypothetical protein
VQLSQIAQEEASDAPAPDYRFARPDLAALTIELATIQSPGAALTTGTSHDRSDQARGVYSPTRARLPGHDCDH